MTDLAIPDHPVLMQTNRDFRLSSLNGVVINFQAGEPTRVPPQAYAEAVGIGAVECEEQLEPPKSQEKKPDPSIAEAAKAEHEAKIEYIKQGILKLMAADDDSAFKPDGYPIHKRLIEVLPPQAPKVTAGEIAEVFDDMRDDLDLADVES